MAGSKVREDGPLAGGDLHPDADAGGSDRAGHPAGGPGGGGEPHDYDAGRPAGGDVGEPVAGGPGSAADRDLADWHYGDASMGEVPDERYHGAGTWPPIYLGPGEGCER